MYKWQKKTDPLRAATEWVIPWNKSKRKKENCIVKNVNSKKKGVSSFIKLRIMAK